MCEGIERESLFIALVQGQDHAGHIEEIKYNEDVQVFPVASQRDNYFHLFS